MLLVASRAYGLPRVNEAQNVPSPAPCATLGCCCFEQPGRGAHRLPRILQNGLEYDETDAGASSEAFWVGQVREWGP